MGEILAKRPDCEMIVIMADNRDGFFTMMMPPGPGYVHIGLLHNATIYMDERTRMNAIGVLQEVVSEDRKMGEFFAMDTEKGPKQ
jgi:hypothetical protein